MSIRAMSAVFRLDLPPGEKWLAMVLADTADEDGWQCSPRVADLAAKSGMSERTVQRTIAALQERRMVDVQANVGTINGYRLLFVPQGGDNMTPPGVIVTGGGDNMTPPSPDDKESDQGLDLGVLTLSVTASPTAVSTAANGRKRDLDFEALCESYHIDWHHLTPPGRAAINAALKNIREAGDVTPDEIRVRAQRHLSSPLGAHTPAGLAKYWSMLATGPVASGNGHTSVAAQGFALAARLRSEGR